MKFVLALAIGGVAIYGLVWLYKKMEEAQDGDEPNNNEDDQSDNHFI